MRGPVMATTRDEKQIALLVGLIPVLDHTVAERRRDAAVDPVRTADAS